ncbi:hypothetical protein DUI87_04289 [Hirundo rustica rustica]|uniref:Kazal-like domain-containing protein n=1 Tax=Hirundo rustica rustica TaxID=333673 RepID=A0A3M0KZ35_HIRRU|nr:hypothetical protein DUI87_04289 [Hirundo rustica rustica]
MTGGKTGVNEGSGETNQKETSTCDICQFGAECDEDAEDVWCVCNIDCSQTNFNPLCASDGKSYDNACQIKEASCQKQEKIEVMSLGRCQVLASPFSEPPRRSCRVLALTRDVNNMKCHENANKLEESARGIYIPCPEHYNGFCMHGKCEHSTNMLEPSCRCDAGYTGQHCEKKDYSVLYVVPGPVRFQYVLIAAVIGTIQIAIICVVVLCITSSSGNFESTELSSRVLSWSKISDNYGCGKAFRQTINLRGFFRLQRRKRSKAGTYQMLAENTMLFHELARTHSTLQDKTDFGKGSRVAECSQCNPFTILSHSRSNLYVAATLNRLRDLQKAWQDSLEPADGVRL